MTTHPLLGHNKNVRQYLALVCTLLSMQLAAQTLDPTFNGSGHLQLDPTTSEEIGEAIAVLADGKLLVVGIAYDGVDLDLMVTALHEDGSTDTGFGNGGTLLISGQGQLWTNMKAVALADGSAVIGAARGSGSDVDLILMHVLAGGTLDMDFAQNGELIIDHGAIENIADLILRPDGNILMASWHSDGSRLTLFDANGALVSGFGISGEVLLGTTTYVNALANASNGGIWLAGLAWNATQNDCWIMRRMASGALDTSFGNNGSTLNDLDPHDQDFSSDGVMAIAEDPDQGLVLLVSVFGDQLGYGRYRLARTLPTGILDSGYGNAGTTELFDSGWSIGYAQLLMEPDGRTVSIGYHQNTLLLAKHLGNGQPDGGWGSGGSATMSPPGLLNYHFAQAAYDQEGRIVAVGYAVDANGVSFAVADRFINDAVSGIAAPERASSPITVFPNPTGSTLQWIAGDRNTSLFEVLDATGACVLPFVQRSTNTLDVSNLAPGRYFLRFANSAAVVPFIRQ